MAEKRKRARNKKGHYIKDDPNTPDINEAYEKPKKKAKKTVKKPKITKKTPKVVHQKPPYGVAGVVLALLLIALYFLSN
jgi:hypothetical protein|tara:strand:- start:310 stop:546 length:237 start_codon:yes stop_codon:yes gene_type:complete